MSLYLDSSALLKRYVREPDTADCERLLHADATWTTARHTCVEVLRNLHRLLEGRERQRLERVFRIDWKRIHVVELDRETCERAGELTKSHALRTLDALHLAAAQRLGGGSIAFLTYDVKQARAARELGLRVIGC